MGIIACIAMIALVLYSCSRDAAGIRRNLSKAKQREEAIERARRQAERERQRAEMLEQIDRLSKSPVQTVPRRDDPPEPSYGKRFYRQDDEEEWIDLSDEYTPRQAESMGFLDGHVRVPNPRAKSKRAE